MEENRTQDLQLEITSPQETTLTRAAQDRITLTNDANDIVSRIVNSNDIEEIKNLTQLFNINAIKKNAMRVNQLNNLMDLINNETESRLYAASGSIEDKDLINYNKVVQQAIVNSMQTLNVIDEKPLIQINTQNINVNDETSLSRESKERVINTIKTIMASLNSSEKNDSIEAEFEEIEEGEENQ